LKQLKGIIHCHSTHSFDSWVSIRKLIKMIKKYRLDFVVLTDHNTIQGAVALRKELHRQQLEHVQVPIAAEYFTEYGDVIAAFITDELDYKGSFLSFVDQVKKQNGILLFPHPYKGHQNIHDVASHCDLIEVFNSRQSKNEDKRAQELQERYQKPSYYASDAHLFSEYGNVILQIEYDTEDLKAALLHGRISCLRCVKATMFDILVSQWMKALKFWRFKLFLQVLRSILKNLVFMRLFKRLD
jgi:predicted metal-dependent phosphoesterase TrpH